MAKEFLLQLNIQDVGSVIINPETTEDEVIELACSKWLELNVPVSIIEKRRGELRKKFRQLRRLEEEHILLQASDRPANPAGLNLYHLGLKTGGIMEQPEFEIVRIRAIWARDLLEAKTIYRLQHSEDPTGYYPIVEVGN